MKNISILLLQGDAVLGSIEGPHKLFNSVNDFLAGAGKPPIFKVQLVGLNNQPVCYEKLFTVQPDITIQDLQSTDLLIIPAIKGDIPRSLSLNQDFVPWIIKQYKQGTEVASVCIGAFLLAYTGLVQGRRCATHWIVANDFRKMFPDVELVADSIITDELGIYTSGGAYSYLNLILYLIEKYAGRHMAIYCSKVFAIEIDRHTQSTFTIFRGQKEHEDECIRQAQEFIEKNFHEKISVEQLASLFSVGRRNFERRFKKATSNTIVEYIQRVKIEAAKKSFESSRENINEVMYKIGYSDSKAFRMVFKKITGLSPIEYRTKYNREIQVI